MADANTAKLDEHGQSILPYIVFHRGAYIVNLPDDLGLSAKAFSLTTHTPAEAQRRARRYRDSKLPASLLTRVRCRERAQAGELLPAVRGVTHRARSSLGRAGVTLTRTKSRGVTTPTVSATAKDHVAGTLNTKRFAIERYGLETALRYAIRLRLKWEGSLFGHVSRLGENDWVRFMLYAHGQFGGEPFKLGQLRHRGSVQDHGNGWLTATTTVRNAPRRKSFNVRHYGSKHEARVAAILCCLDWQEALGEHHRQLSTDATARNHTTGRVGVCRRLINDGRGQSALVAYEALVYVNGKRRPRRFNAGREHRITAIHDLAAFEAAVAYRRAYEEAVAAGARFEPGLYRDWKVLFNHPAASESTAAA